MNPGKNELSWIGRKVWGRVGLFGSLIETQTLERRGVVPRVLICPRKYSVAVASLTTDRVLVSDGHWEA